MKEKITYLAEDGTEFSNKQECLDYETVKNWNKEDIKKAFETLKLIKYYCDTHECVERICPFDSICETCVSNWVVEPTPTSEDIKELEEKVEKLAEKVSTNPCITASKAYWIHVETEHDVDDTYYCSNCHKRHKLDITSNKLPNFCDHCGMIMEDECITIPICHCYDTSTRCNGTRERDYVTCHGDRLNCKIYDEVPKKAFKEANDLHYEREQLNKTDLLDVNEPCVHLSLGAVSTPFVDNYYIYISGNEAGQHNLATASIGKFLSSFQNTFTVQSYPDYIESTYAWRRKTGKYIDWDLYPLHMFNICRFNMGIYVYIHNEDDRNILSQYIYNVNRWKDTLDKHRDCVVYIKDNKIVTAENLISYSFTGSPKLIWRVDKHGFLYSLDVMEYLNAPHTEHLFKDIPYVINTENQCIYEVTQLSAPKTYRLDILPNHGEESLYIYNDTPLAVPYVPLNLDNIKLYNIDIVLYCNEQETVKRVLKYFDLAPIYSDLIVSIENGEVKECSKGTIYTNFPRFNVSINEKNELEFTYAFSYK